jgi:hypothetical protein
MLLAYDADDSLDGVSGMVFLGWFLRNGFAMQRG